MLRNIRRPKLYCIMRGSDTKKERRALRRLLCMLFCGYLFAPLYAENIKTDIPAGIFQNVAGKVVSATDGQPLPGATVMIKGTSKGTVTDFDGNYELAV